MTVLPWPADLFSRRPKPVRKLIVDPLPQSVLHQLVADLPGPKHETDAERAARFETQLAELLRYKPRDAADAMIAAHCLMLRLLAEDCHRDADNARHQPAKAKKLQRTAKQFDQLLANMEQTLARRQAEPPPKLDPAMYASFGLEQFLIPDPDDAIEEEAFSAIIVPLHPAPKLLQ
jgi:hypothetical protein